MQSFGLSLSLAGRNGIVGGGSRSGGISERVVESLLMAGATVTFIDRDARGEQLATRMKQDGHNVLFIEADLTDEEAVAGAVRKHVATFGLPSFLVNVAGGSGHTMPTLLAESTKADLEAAFHGNVVTAHVLTRAAIDYLKAVQGDKIIVNTGSINGLAGCGYLCEGVYSTAKASLIGYTMALAAENRRHGVRAVLIAPASVPGPESPTWNDRFADPQTAAELQKLYPLGMIKPDDIANSVVFLISPLGRQINAITLIIDGGLTGVGAREVHPEGKWWLSPQATELLATQTVLASE